MVKKNEKGGKIIELVNIEGMFTSKQDRSTHHHYSSHFYELSHGQHVFRITFHYSFHIPFALGNYLSYLQFLAW